MLPDEITEDIDLAAGAAITSEGEDSIGDIELPSPLDGVFDTFLKPHLL